MSEKSINDFDHLLRSLRYGCPPHGGIALGLDRLAMLLAEASSIREVIAFPKAKDGRDLCTKSPVDLPRDFLLEIKKSADKSDK